MSLRSAKSLRARFTVVCELSREATFCENNFPRQRSMGKRSSPLVKKNAAAAALFFVLASPTPAEETARVVALGFSPGQGCVQLETDLIATAQKEVLIQACGQCFCACCSF